MPEHKAIISVELLSLPSKSIYVLEVVLYKVRKIKFLDWKIVTLSLDVIKHICTEEYIMLLKKTL